MTDDLKIVIQSRQIKSTCKVDYLGIVTDEKLKREKYIRTCLSEIQQSILKQ